MAVMVRIPVTSPSKGMAISHVIISKASGSSFSEKVYRRSRHQKSCQQGTRWQIEREAVLVEFIGPIGAPEWSLFFAEPAVQGEVFCHLHDLTADLLQLRSISAAL